MSRSTLTFFLLVVSFGILFAGCSGSPEPDQEFEEFVFTDEDLQKIHEIAGTASLSSSSSEESIVLGAMDRASDTAASTESDTSDQSPVDSVKQRLYENIRTAIFDQGGNVFRVNNAFLNVRSAMGVGSAQVERLSQGDVLTVLEIPNAGWAKVKLQDGKEGYVSLRYIAKLTTEQRLAEEKKKYEGQYFVDFQFLNIRKDPSVQSEKIGELPGQAIVKPVTMNGEWARVSFEGKEGYVSTQYLKPFLPVFLVRQEEYAIPILQYQADDTGSMQALPKHVDALIAAGKKLVTLKSLADTVLAQETRDARVNPGTVVVVVTGVIAKNVRAVSDALASASMPGATLFLEAGDIGIDGITEKMMLSLLANGNDLQSGGHTGDDLRSMTDSQVALELRQSKKLIEDITHKEVYAIGYPRGAVNDRVMEKAAELAYLFGVSQSPDRTFLRSQFLRLPSLIVTSGMSPEDVVKLAEPLK